MEPIPEDPYRLQRFLDAQDERGTYDRALVELRSGCKRTHWMWFVFPQLVGLGRSATAKIYAISSLAEASAYLEHPILGPRLLECARALTRLSSTSAEEILGEIDAMKLRSSMTLFAHADPQQPLFREVLEQYFAGVMDEATERLIDA